MNEITPELREKFLWFHEVYEITKAKLQDEGASGLVMLRGFGKKLKGKSH